MSNSIGSSEHDDHSEDRAVENILSLIPHKKITRTV
jgi:hypothetical protein